MNYGIVKCPYLLFKCLRNALLIQWEHLGVYEMKNIGGPQAQSRDKPPGGGLQCRF